MDAVETIGVHIVWKPRRASDTGDHSGIVPVKSKLCHDRLYLFQDRIISATGAPTHILVRCKILGGKLFWLSCHGCCFSREVRGQREAARIWLSGYPGSCCIETLPGDTCYESTVQVGLYSSREQTPCRSCPSGPQGFVGKA